MSLGALGPLLGCSWLALASLWLPFELVLLACLAFSYCLSDLGTMLVRCDDHTWAAEPHKSTKKRGCMTYWIYIYAKSMSWVCSSVWTLVSPSASPSSRFFFPLLRSRSTSKPFFVFVRSLRVLLLLVLMLVFSVVVI